MPPAGESPDFLSFPAWSSWQLRPDLPELSRPTAFCPIYWYLLRRSPCPVVEILAGICLLGNVRGSLAIITLLMLLFMAVLGYGIWLGLDVDCGCFSPEDPEALAFHGLRQAMFRDMAIMAVLVGMYVWRYHRAPRPVQLRKIL